MPDPSPQGEAGDKDKAKDGDDKKEESNEENEAGKGIYSCIATG